MSKMTDNVIRINFSTVKDISASDVLRNIADNNPKHVFVIAWPEDGSMPSYHSSTSDMPVILMRINEFVHKYYNGDFQ